MDWESYDRKSLPEDVDTRAVSKQGMVSRQVIKDTRQILPYCVINLTKADSRAQQKSSLNKTFSTPRGKTVSSEKRLNILQIAYQ